MSVAIANTEESEALRRAQRAHEPSMEEILASIRSIIADDREPAPAKPGPQIVYSSDAPARAEPPEPTPAPTVVWSRKAEAPEPARAQEDDDGLLSDDAGYAVAGSFKALSDSMAAHGLEVAEGMAREMLRPMLKAWLDENLPPLVERLVRAEIQRVTRGR